MSSTANSLYVNQAVIRESFSANSAATVSFGGARVRDVGAPVADDDAVNLGHLKTQLATDFSQLPAVDLATSAKDASQFVSQTVVGGIITGPGLGQLRIDLNLVTVGQRILVKDGVVDTDPHPDGAGRDVFGIYIVNKDGSGADPFELQRTGDALVVGAVVEVYDGYINPASTWTVASNKTWVKIGSAVPVARDGLLFNSNDGESPATYFIDEVDQSGGWNFKKGFLVESDKPVIIFTKETLGFSGSNITFRDPNIAGDDLSSGSFTVDSIIIGTPTINAGNIIWITEGDI